MNQRQLQLYKSDNIFNSIIYFFIDGLGLAELFGTPMLNTTWWYMSFAIFAIILIPIFITIYKKYGITILLGELIFIPRVFNIHNENIVRWLFVLALGIFVADKNIFERLNQYKFLKNKNDKLNKFFKFILYTAILGIFIIFGKNMNNTFREFKDGILPVFIIYYCYEFILPIKYINVILQYLGKHSINIFLVHTFIRHYYFKDFIYYFKYSFLIVLVLLSISLIISIIIEFLKKIIRYDKLINFIKEKVNTRLEMEEKQWTN